MTQPTIGQNFESDPEVKEIRSRITEVSWSISDGQYQNSGAARNETYIQFTVELELWNPYDRGLISYGSSSCRWFALLEIHFASTYAIENSGEMCTADYGPREYLSGLSNETSNPGLVFLNESLSFIPNGNITISGTGGTFENITDPSYGVSISFIEGEAIYTYQSTPQNWGEILFIIEESDSRLNIDAPFNLILLTGSIIFFRLILKARKY